MIVVCDINEVWRRKPFAAMAGLADVLGVSPRDWFLARRQPAEDDGLETLRAVLPPGWASQTGWLGQPMLWRRIAGECRRRGSSIDGLVVTSPHYLALLDSLPRGLPVFYYASDDYRVYKGWHRMEQLENQLIRRVNHAFFVSRGLAERAVREYGADPARVSVSMNATEPRFFAPPGSLPCEPPSGPLPRPIAGVVGVVNDRLDFDLLLQCADLPTLGTLLLAGPLPRQPSASLRRLLAHPKCAAVGAQPHGEIHRWFAAWMSGSCLFPGWRSTACARRCASSTIWPAGRRWSQQRRAIRWRNSALRLHRADRMLIFWRHWRNGWHIRRRANRSRALRGRIALNNC